VRLAHLAPLADLSIPLDPHGPQPNAYGAWFATAEPYSGLDTRIGGSVNCEEIGLIPHCNGTHTESVGHITRERFPLSAVPLPLFMPCAVISVTPDGREIRAEHLGGVPGQIEAIVVRTLPNDLSKLTRKWENDATPYFTPDAMQSIRARGVNHLLVDLPSVDPLYDGGALAAHRVFWDMAPGSTELPGEEARRRTITEMIFVPDEVPDGRYLLTIQTPPLVSDAVPSRPLLFSVEDGE
jgi:kynurenine formamidase